MHVQSLRRRQFAQINIVPYIDVMLVLMLIFMIATPLMQQGVRIDLPQAPSAPVRPEPFHEPLVLEVDHALQLRLVRAGAGSLAVAEAELAEAVARSLQPRDGEILYIRADASLPYGAVVSLMARLEQSEIATLGLLTEPLPSARP